MAGTAYTAVQLCDRAAGRLGDYRITSLDATSAVPLVRFFALEYDGIRDAVQEAHPWNFCTRRVTLAAYTEPSATLTPAATTGTNISFTADADVFSAEDATEGRVLVATDGGRATITTFVTAQQVAADITEDFDSADPIDEGDWQLYNAAPEHTYDYKLTIPDGWLRIYRPRLAAHEGGDYDVEGDYVLANEETLDVRVIFQETDPAKFSPMFTEALVTRLIAEAAERVTGQESKAARYFQKYEHLLRQAKTRDGQEGTPESLRSNILLDARRGVRTWV